jgi:CheY-like chemotaxis protein
VAKLLIVDDNADIIELLADVCRCHGYEVRVAQNGEQGYQILHEKKFNPDVILLDIEMPVLDGPGMAMQMLIHDAGLEHIPVVILSGVADLTKVATRVGTPYALVKPVKVDTLIRTLELAIKENQGLQPDPQWFKRP